MRKKKQKLKRIYIDDDDDDDLDSDDIQLVMDDTRTTGARATLEATGWLRCENVSSSDAVSSSEEAPRPARPSRRNKRRQRKNTTDTKRKKAKKKAKKKKENTVTSLYGSPDDDEEAPASSWADAPLVDLTTQFSEEAEDDDEDDDVLTFRGLYTPGKLSSKPRRRPTVIVIEDDEEASATPPMSPERRQSSQPVSARYTIGASRTDSSSSGRFAAAGSFSAQASATQDASVSWGSKYSPASSADLGMHARKIKDIRKWLQSCKGINKSSAATRGITCKALVLSGPSGSCKSSVVRCLAAELGMEVVEWLNPASCLWKNDEYRLTTRYEAQLAQFSSFLSQCGRYNSLSGGSNNQKLVLIDDPPFLLRTEQLRQFRAIFSEYLSAGRFPLVFLLTDSAEGTSDMHRILGQLQYSPLIKMITTRPVADTIMRRVLLSVLSKEHRQVETPVLNRVMAESHGDVRSALNSLQMMCVGSFQKPVVKKRKSTNSNKKTAKERNEELAPPISVSSVKDISFSLFHGIGKVFFPKRDASGRLLTDPEDIHRRTPISTSQLALFLHENLVSRFTDIADVHEAMESLSVCDLMLSGDLEPERQSFMQYAGSLAVRGVLHANRHPKKPRGMDPFYRPHIREFGQDSDYRTEMAHSLFPPDQGADHGGFSALPTRVLMTEALPFVGKMVLNPVQQQNNPTLVSARFTRPQQTFLYHICSFGTVTTVRRTKEARVAQGSAPESLLVSKKFHQFGFGDTGVLSDDDIEEDE